MRGCDSHLFKSGLGVLWLASLAAGALALGFVYGTPPGHSLANNLVWLQNFDAAFWDGEFYPRWLSQLWFGAGAPDFYFYGPLPFWISSLFGHGTCRQCTTDQVLMLGTLALFFISGVGYWLFARPMVGGAKALIAAALYMILPYHLMMDWGVRQALGELSAYAVLPFLAGAIAAFVRQKKYAGPGLALAIAAMFLSHLPSVVISAVVLGPTTLLLLAKNRPEFFYQWRTAAGLVVFATLGVGIAALYWLPAIVFLPDVASQTLWQTSFDWSNWIFFDGQPEPNPPMTMLLKFWLMVIMILAGLMARRLRTTFDPAVWFYVPLLIALIFMTPLSWPLWKYFGILQAIQFPWRFMMLAEFGVPLALVALLPETRRAQLVAGGVLSIVAVVNGFAGYQLAQILGLPRDVVQGNVADNISAWEYLPNPAYQRIIKLTGGKRDAVKHDWLANPGEAPQVQALPSATHITAQQLSTRHWSIAVEAPTATHITLRQFYWTLWQATDVQTGKAIALTPDDKFGLISFDVAAGTTHADLRLQVHWAERLGQLISLVSLFMVLVLAALKRSVRT